MKDYQLIIRIPVKAVDDPDARAKAFCIFANLDLFEIYGDSTHKLQRMEEGKPPEGISL